MTLKPIVILAFLLSAILPRLAISTEQLDVEIRSTILNIRAIRSTDSPVVGVLYKGEQLKVTTTDMRDWIRLDDGRGFISIHYVDVLSRQPLPSIQNLTDRDTSLNKPTLTPAAALESFEEDRLSPQQHHRPQTDNAVIQPAVATISGSPLKIEAISKTCRKNVTTQHYEFCQLDFELRLSQPITTNQSINRSTNQPNKIICYADALTTNTQGLHKRYELSKTRLISHSASTHHVTVEWFPTTEQALIKQLILREGVCQRF
ncbi:SH3 domain-containing protein [Amphritea sp. 1_MG-2023]|uniref:SH3 domain-containing protein n=1 Tax=Amphritea sp. 1_MG-2023 TaxID=3062670 RepID=UPI0026E21959|nr:SH3 domain-containing protein [Amphritea sp. 1_MG-2023]MDO6565309.1 SH3 domain-containing protein [Amphritea sp. 1_MG-2023]